VVGSVGGGWIRIDDHEATGEAVILVAMQEAGSDPLLDTLTVLFTDLVGSTELRAKLGEDAAEVVRRAHDSLIATVVDASGGHMIKGLGDGFLATFGSAASAVSAAVAIQQGIDAQKPPAPDVALAVRIGLSVGDVSVEDGDVFGTPVIEAARLCDLAEGGQILASAVIETLARRRDGHGYRDKGPLELKGLPDPVPTVEVVWERVAAAERGVAFPAPLMVREGTFPFSGRAGIVDQLVETWKHCREDERGACVLISGEPGMGKTRLAAEFARRAHDGGATVLLGRCDEEIGLPYQPFVEALSHFVAGSADAAVECLGPNPGELARIVPALRTTFPDVPTATGSGDAEVDQYHLFEAVSGWLGAAASESGLVLVLDDVHWAGKPTLVLLRHILRSADTTPLMILATYRDTDLDRMHPLANLLADLRRVPAVERIALTGLDQSGIEELIETAAQQELDDASRALAAAVYAETEGNPFFVGELLRHLIENGDLVNDGERWVGSTSVSEMTIPDGIREVVGRRLSRLSAEANDVLAWAAVVGREFNLDVLGQVAGGSSRCLDAVDEAVDARLVDEAGPTRWRFAHALVRSTLLAELRTTRRLRMHLSVAEACESIHPDDTLALAQHYAEAAPLDVGDKAVTYLLLAGARALDTLAFDEAGELHQRALDTIDDLGLDLPEQAADAAHGLAVALRWTGQDYEPAIDRACELAAAIGDGHRMARVLLDTSRGFVARVFEVVDRAVARHEQCLAILPDGDSQERALVTAALSRELMYGDQARFVALSDEAVAMARRLDDPAVLCDALSSAAMVCTLPDRLDHAADVIAELTHIVEANQTPSNAAASSQQLAGLGAWTGDRSMYAEGLEKMSRAVDQMRKSASWQLTASQCGFELRFGDLTAAERLAEELLALVTETGEQDGLIWYVNLRGFTLRELGRNDEAADLFGSIVDQASAVSAIAEAHHLMSLCEADRHAEARERAPSAFAWGRTIPRDSSFLPNLGALSIVAVELADSSEAAWLYEQLEPFEHWWSTWSSQGTIAPVATLLGRLSAILGDSGAADAHFDRAITHCRQERTPYFLADGLLHRAQARLAAGAEPSTATPLLEESLTLARAGGFGLLERRAAAALGSTTRVN